MSNKILILGASGMLGWQITDKLLKVGEKLTLTVSNSNSEKKLRNKVNKNLKIIKIDFLKEKKVLKKIITKHNIIINCIGLIKPYINDKSQQDIKKALTLNSLLPDYINDVIKNSNIKVYQIATDCVFSGKDKNYLENSKHDCDDVYGKTKSLGEINSKNYFNLRCSIIGEEIKNYKSLISWFISNKNGASLNGFVNHEWNGLTTNAFAEVIKTLITSNIKIPNLIHLIPKNKISKYKLLNMLNFKYQTNFKINKFKSNISINRTLNTNYKKINQIIWKKTKYGKAPSIETMISEI